MINNAIAIQTLPYARKPGAKKSFLNSRMVETDCSWGPFMAMMTAPRMHWMQPIQPKSVRVSLRKKWDRMAQMTTERAPSGVLYTWMSVMGRRRKEDGNARQG